ncbi:hypothetical protein HY571_02195 [Candidatus Micrarchaeota archaeon]|nr:hypothetical protein [Candidatus Micrarchaeota archaeon]
MPHLPPAPEGERAARGCEERRGCLRELLSGDADRIGWPLLRVVYRHEILDAFPLAKLL